VSFKMYEQLLFVFLKILKQGAYCVIDTWIIWEHRNWFMPRIFNRILQIINYI
jgi:hypothetical protein